MKGVRNLLILDDVKVVKLKTGAIFVEHGSADGSPCIQFNGEDTSDGIKWMFYLYGETATKFKEALAAGQEYRITGSVRIKTVGEKKFYLVDVADMTLRKVSCESDTSTTKIERQEKNEKRDPYALDPLMFAKDIGTPMKHFG